ncbi:hypothetical protein [Agrobacterium rubi]|uniref:Uncharacterized protein n=1 Tax=Agrobacterium rubi TaxID=28099 RepID=A0AAE7URC8_9HYPH|nr:hypothetical protein [Agrobacterium rubi]NTE85808.1 hypothetical protein [Agrobacterium rubi]NTF01740.1 hypothetical protein [Agrobacterium rubi]NTF35983.1 hypothetical protein [Agrobacterium rubi]OCJ53211.1 hypothetical protein A6U92_24935 [Agrobacterium rubi]QTG01076.1 hypothetical protein G6M88_12070 [Agrobacterium rubi]
MTTSACPIYLFRSTSFARSGETVVSVAPLDYVIKVYGSGGVVGEAGLSSSFGGAAVFRNDVSNECFIGVWGARNASRFRSELRTQMQVTIHKQPPDARLAFWESAKTRPQKLTRE